VEPHQKGKTPGIMSLGGEGRPMSGLRKCLFIKRKKGGREGKKFSPEGRVEGKKRKRGT